MLVSSLAVVKSYILAGDVHQGLTFLRCSEKATKLEELSRVRHTVTLDCMSRHISTTGTFVAVPHHPEHVQQLLCAMHMLLVTLGEISSLRDILRCLITLLCAQDFGQTDVRAADFLINGRKLYLAAADAGQTLRLWSYEQHAQSWGGKRLLPLCALVHAMFLPRGLQISRVDSDSHAGWVWHIW